MESRTQECRSYNYQDTEDIDSNTKNNQGGLGGV